MNAGDCRALVSLIFTNQLVERGQNAPVRALLLQYCLSVHDDGACSSCVQVLLVQ
ncbi:hypothetical protein BDA96_01G512600 [Sorghum bicolor]|uniref:Uncharacterized protein n=1 Tax=Sorghum bicolor TaxID=4558 RepID=A0A921S8J9_SORBI|nr:hypothetical protein BDA96_01G512600 [Sorghum bicolor]